MAVDAISRTFVARAVTVGNHVAFNAGEYDPESPEGQHVLAHVRQQTGGAVSMLPQEDLGLEIDPDSQLDREAEETAQRVMEGGELGIQRLGRTDIHVQRQPIYGPTLGASHNGTVTDTAALEDDLEVAGAMSKAVAKTFLKRFIPNEVIAAYDAKKVIEEPSFQDTLQNARFSSDWLSDFGDLLENDDVMAALGRAIDPTAARPDDAPLSAALAEIMGKDPADIPSLSDGLLLEAVSGLHVHWDDVAGQYHTQWGEQPDIERDPHARIEIFEFDPDSIVELKCQIARHLLCQVRDCYLGMGIAPPEPFRLLGAGHHGAGTRYEHSEFYDRYHDPTAEISTWYEEYMPDNASEMSVAPAAETEI